MLLASFAKRRTQSLSKIDLVAERCGESVSPEDASPRSSGGMTISSATVSSQADEDLASPVVCLAPPVYVATIQDEPVNMFGEVRYNIVVSDGRGEWNVAHTVADFEALRTMLQNQAEFSQARFRGRAQLDAFLQHALAADLVRKSQECRVFLCIGSTFDAPAQQQTVVVSPQPETLPTRQESATTRPSPPTMWQHMYPEKGDLVGALRRRSMTLVDVVAERQCNGRFEAQSILGAFFVAWAYWTYLLPRIAMWGVNQQSRQLQHSGVDGLQHNGTTFRPGGPWSEVRISSALLCSFGYLMIVTVGVRIMDQRPPIRRRVFEYMFMYNMIQVVLNAWLATSLWFEAWRLGFSYPWGNPLSSSESGYGLGLLLWLQYHCRQLDLLDTVFIVLRKKFHRLSFLHIALRLGHMWGWFFICRFACGGDSYFPAAVNSSCQVLVYIYYTLSMLQQVKVPFFKRARVTEVQVVQFVICSLHALYVLIHGHLPRSIVALQLVVMALSLFLYMDYDTSAMEKPAESGTNGSEDMSSTIDAAPKLTFCFDCSGWLMTYHFGVGLWIRDHMLPEINTENAATDAYPSGLMFSGCSGGSFVAGALSTGIDVLALYDFMLTSHSDVQLRPWRLFGYVDKALCKFLPKTCASAMSGRCRILMTRISCQAPFVTGEVSTQFENYEECFHSMRASAHVPGLNPCPYRFKRNGRKSWGAYFDGMLWGSLLVPWQCSDDSHVVTVSALCAPLTDIRAPYQPLWWAMVPPGVDILRGMMWQGYQDAAAWFAEGATNDPCDVTRCAVSPQTPPGEEDRLQSYRTAKHLAAQRFVHHSKPMPVVDPVTGQNVADLIAAYHVACKAGVRAAAVTACVVGALSLCFVGWFFFV